MPWRNNFKSGSMLALLSGIPPFAISEKALWNSAKLQNWENCRLHVFRRGSVCVAKLTCFNKRNKVWAFPGNGRKLLKIMKGTDASNKQTYSCWQDKAFSLSHCWLKSMSNSAYACYACQLSPSIVRDMPVKSELGACSVNLTDFLFPQSNGWMTPVAFIQEARGEIDSGLFTFQIPPWI